MTGGIVLQERGACMGCRVLFSDREIARLELPPCSLGNVCLVPREMQCAVFGGAGNAANSKYNWSFPEKRAAPEQSDPLGRLVMDLPVAAIRRPLGRTRGNSKSPWS